MYSSSPRGRAVCSLKAPSIWTSLHVELEAPRELQLLPTIQSHLNIFEHLVLRLRLPVHENLPLQIWNHVDTIITWNIEVKHISIVAFYNRAHTFKRCVTRFSYLFLALIPINQYYSYYPSCWAAGPAIKTTVWLWGSRSHALKTWCSITRGHVSSCGDFKYCSSLLSPPSPGGNMWLFTSLYLD